LGFFHIAASSALSIWTKACHAAMKIEQADRESAMVDRAVSDTQI